MDHELCRVAQFNFHDEASGKPRLPRKILLSPDKRLLLLLGVFHQSHCSLLVCVLVILCGAFLITCSHHIFDTPEYFKPIFHDLSLTFLDACFSPDSSSLAIIPTKHPHLLFLVQLSLDSPSKPAKSSSSAAESPRQQAVRAISFEPRVVGPIQILGPARSTLGTHHFRANRVSASVSSASTSSHAFVTWSDEGTGEYCVWSLPKEVDAKTPPKPDSSCRLLLGKGLDKAFFEVRYPRALIPTCL